MVTTTAIKPSLTVRMPPLHAGQREVRDSDARFRVLACGRRWGKTLLGVVLCLAEALQGRRAWWVAPSYPIASIGWREIRRLAKQIPGAEIRETDRQALLPGGGWVQVKSADNPNSLRGEGLHFVVLDEAAYIAEEAWAEALRPALSDKEGRALFISTPNGHNWFWRAWNQQGAEWRSWQKPTIDNPFIKPEEVETARDLLPEHVFAQEYLAAFMADAGAVFRRLLEASILAPQEPIAGHVYVVGCDWGKLNDFSVFSVLDVTVREQVYLDRSNRIDYVVQVGRLKALCDRYKPAAVIAEANSMGQAIIEQVQRARLPVISWTATQATKQQMIEELSLALEQSSVKLLKNPVQLAELQAFEATRTPSGLLRYAAPEGQHDDTVIALGLSWLGVRQTGRTRVLDFRVEAA